MKSLSNGLYVRVITDISIGCFFVEVYADKDGEDLLFNLCKTCYYYQGALDYIASLA